MNATDLQRETNELQKFFRKQFPEGALELVWLELLAEPAAALVPAMKRLKIERSALPTVAAVVATIQEEARKIEARLRTEEEEAERRKRNQWEMLTRRKQEEAELGRVVPAFVREVYRLCGRIASGTISIEDQLETLYAMLDRWPNHHPAIQEMIDDREEAFRRQREWRAAA